MLKYCNLCKEDKPLFNFAFKNKAKQTLQPYCNVCRRQKAKEHYEANKKHIVARSIANNITSRKWYGQLKHKLACCVCGEDESVCLDFHHIDPKTKKFEISGIGRSKSKKTLIEEINKCACLCANCHRKHHAGKLNASLVKLDITQIYEI